MSSEQMNRPTRLILRYDGSDSENEICNEDTSILIHQDAQPLIETQEQPSQGKSLKELLFVQPLCERYTFDKRLIVSSQNTLRFSDNHIGPNEIRLHAYGLESGFIIETEAPVDYSMLQFVSLVEEHHPTTFESAASGGDQMSREVFEIELNAWAQRVYIGHDILGWSIEPINITSKPEVMICRQAERIYTALRSEDLANDYSGALLRDTLPKLYRPFILPIREIASYDLKYLRCNAGQKIRVWVSLRLKFNVRLEYDAMRFMYPILYADRIRQYEY